MLKFIVFKIYLMALTFTLNATASEMNVPTKPWLRLPDPIEGAKMNAQGTRIAFTTGSGQELKVLNLKTLKVRKITDHSVDQSFLWSPDGIRVFYREQLRDKKNLMRANLKAYDARLRKTVSISEFSEPTGVLNLDPRDLRLSLLTSKGVHTNRLKFPDKREARWQMAARDIDGRFLVTGNAVLWITDGGLTMRRLSKVDDEVISFDLSPDGLALVWATRKDHIYVSEAGQKAKLIDYGQDPKWHPARQQIIFAGARRIGNVTHNFDLKISDLKGKGRFITKTQLHNERWPVWAGDKGRIYFTRSQTTDLYEMELM